MLNGLTFDLLKQFSNFFIFDRNDLLESIKLNTEDLSLIFKILLDVLQLKVYHFLKLFFESTYLLVLLVNWFGSLLLFILYHWTKPWNFLIFFFSDFLNPIGDNLLNSFFLMNHFF